MFAVEPTVLLDEFRPGDPQSEQRHAFSAEGSETIDGALGLKARRFLPPAAAGWEGGRASFAMKVDPGSQNYLTARFWGDEANPNFLVLLCEGKQVGYRHLGDIDVLGLPDEEPRYNGRFYYVTTPLPLALTTGKTEVKLEVRSSGPIWRYGRNFEQYQKPMTEPSRGIYSLATHTAGCFIPATSEVQGKAPTETVRESGPGVEVLDAVKKRACSPSNSFLCVLTFFLLIVGGPQAHPSSPRTPAAASGAGFGGA